MISLLAAFQFLTIFPGILRRPFTPAELGRAVGWYPLVGLAVGGALFGLHAALTAFFSSAITAAFTLLAWVILTRALHFDGFIDMCDAVFGGFTPERRLEILKDTGVGAFGLAGGVLLLLVKYATLANPSGSFPGLLLAPVLARWAISIALFSFPYLKLIITMYVLCKFILCCLS